MGYCLIQCLEYLIQLLIESQKFHEDVYIYRSVGEMGIGLLKLFCSFTLFILFCISCIFFCHLCRVTNLFMQRPYWNSSDCIWFSFALLGVSLCVESGHGQLIGLHWENCQDD